MPPNVELMHKTPDEVRQSCVSVEKTRKKVNTDCHEVGLTIDEEAPESDLSVPLPHNCVICVRQHNFYVLFPGIPGVKGQGGNLAQRYLVVVLSEVKSV